ncbi:MAG TPA: hypothetical protein VK791_02180, partial [bacterium]|nr:hypothetical protein [bacterium]
MESIPNHDEKLQGLRKTPPPKTPLWQLILLILVSTVLITYGYIYVQGFIKDREQAKRSAQEQAAAEALPHQQIQAKIQNLLQHGTALPPCPLVYPLLDNQGRVTPLGSYLSYFSMKQASYLPKTVFSIPNAGEIFNEFDLFTPNSPKQKVYKDQLPYYFGNVKDFGEGKILKAGSGTKIQLRFWGTQKSKKYSKIFKKGKLHLAISWMASCLQDYMGFKANADQTAYRDKPIFVDDKDLTRAAQLETFFRNDGGSLITGWDAILAKNPDNPYLIDRWLDILDLRGGAKRLETMQKMIEKNPDNTFSKLDYLVECLKAEQYDAGISIGFQEMSRDDNDPDWYDLTVDCLEWKGYYSEAVQLLNAWAKLHPDNQEAWMKLKDVEVSWAWVARGSGWANTVTKEGERLMVERMGDAVAAGTKAAQIAPGDGRVWSKLLSLGNGSSFTHDQMKVYFDKMFKTNPNRSQGYDAYLEYLKPKWNGTEEEMLSFARKYDEYDPGLLAAACAESFEVYSDDDTDEGEKNRAVILKRKMEGSKELKEFEKSELRHLSIHPEDMNLWSTFLGWEDQAGHQNLAFDLAKKLSKQNPELKALPPTLYLAWVKAAKDNMAGLDEKAKFAER